MNAYSNDFDFGQLTSLHNLNLAVQSLNSGDDVWLALPVPYLLHSNEKEMSSYVLIGQEGVNGDGVRDRIFFLFPMGSLLGEEISPSSLIVNVGGFATMPVPFPPGDPELRTDPMDDFDRMWTPLKKALDARKIASDSNDLASNASPAKQVPLRIYAERLLRHKDLLQETIENRGSLAKVEALFYVLGNWPKIKSEM